jgi:glutamine synthetase
MSLRLQAIKNLSNQENIEVGSPAKITAIFCQNVFTIKTAREYLSDEAYKSLVSSIKGLLPVFVNGPKAKALHIILTGFNH